MWTGCFARSSSLDFMRGRLVACAGLIWLWPKQLPAGCYGFAVLGWYGLGRFWLEPLRQKPDVLHGVRVDQVLRSDSVFLQNQARRTSGDLARADAELAGLRNAEAAIEQAGIYPAIVEFESALAALR